MGLFDIFRRTPAAAKPREKLHPVFGRIVFQGVDGWEFGRAVFPPVGHEVELIIEADSEGPAEAHLRFWRELIDRWPALKAACEPLLRQALVDWVEAPERGEVWSRVAVETLTIYPAVPAQWELTFLCEEAGHWPTITMHHWTPTRCHMDG